MTPSVERRRQSRAAISATAYLTIGRHTRPALVTDLSDHGARLRGVEHMAVGTWLSFSLVVPPLELETAGHVIWVDAARSVVGVELASTGWHHDQQLALLRRSLDEELHLARSALVAIEDPRVAAVWCESLRHHAYVPHAVPASLAALAAVEAARPRTRLVVLDAAADVDDLARALAERYPEVVCVARCEDASLDVERVEDCLTDSLLGFR